MKLAALLPCILYLASAAAAPLDVELEERAKNKVPNPVTFKQPGTFQFTSPLSNVASWTIECTGASGGAGGLTNSNPNSGGLGGVARGTFLLYPNIAYNVTIGQQGGSGVAKNSRQVNSAGGGGGASSVFLVGYNNNGQAAGSTQYFLTAAGGGGAGAGAYGNNGASNNGQSYGIDQTGSPDNTLYAGGAGGGLTATLSNNIVNANNGQNGYAATDMNFRQATGRPGFGGFGGGAGGGSGTSSGGGGGGGWAGGNAAANGNGGGAGYSYVQSDCYYNNNQVSGTVSQYAGASSSGNGKCVFTYYSANTASRC